MKYLTIALALPILFLGIRFATPNVSASDQPYPVSYHPYLTEEMVQSLDQTFQLINWSPAEQRQAFQSGGLVWDDQDFVCNQSHAVISGPLERLCADLKHLEY